jgi:hypothetical protein
LLAELGPRPAAPFADAGRPSSVSNGRPDPRDAARHDDQLMHERPRELGGEAHARRPAERCTDEEDGRVRHDDEDAEVWKEDCERDGRERPEAEREQAASAAATVTQHRGAHDGAEQRRRGEAGSADPRRHTAEKGQARIRSTASLNGLGGLLVIRWPSATSTAQVVT